MNKVYAWAKKYGAAENLIPTLFDFPELWKLNATRCRGFNWWFIWVYALCLPFFVFYTFLCLMEAIWKWRGEKHETKENSVLHGK